MEYKFRGKRTDTGEWVYGSLLIDSSQNKSYIVYNDTGYLNDVIPETVGQFTGLYDSTTWEDLTEAEKIEFYNLHKFEEYKTIEDVKELWQGREIYEGDILQLWRSVGSKGDLRSEYYKPLAVTYCDLWCQFVIEHEEIKEQYGIYQTFGAFKVIGNIHDNSDFLEGKNND